MKKPIICVVVALVVLAACSSTKSSSSSGGTTSGTGAAGGSAPGVTPTEIHLGALEYKAFYDPAVTGANARFARQNAQGGVFGRKIVIDNAIDDNQDNNTDITAAKTLVEQDHEFALLPVMTAAFAAAPYLESQKVPFFGWSIQPNWCQLQYGFGFEGNDCDPHFSPTSADLGPLVSKLFPDGTDKGKSVAILTEDNNSATVEIEGFSAGWQHDGARVVLTDHSMPSPPAVTGDYTPYAQKVMTADNGKPADALQFVMSVSDTLGLYKKLLQLGYKGVMQDFTLYDPRVAAATPGLVTEIQFAPFEEAGQLPAVAQMVKDLQAYQPGMVLSQPAAAGYWTADLFLAMLQKVGPNLTRDSFMKVANGGFHWDYGGAAATVTFPGSHQAGTGPACFAYVKSNGKTFDVAVPFTCSSATYPNPLHKG